MSDAGRIRGIDGIRGLAAMYVVLHHCYLASFPGYPVNTGPSWATPLLYGHLSVAIFIVVSGFSLGVGPARNGWRLRGIGRFGQRRAWRILPPYWAALVFSLIVAWTVVPQPGAGTPSARSVVVHTLLVQDLIGSPTPNGAMWSIAVEAQLYLVFPLLLVLIRRFGSAAMVAVVAVVVSTIGATHGQIPAVEVLMRVTPQFAVLFAMGLAAAGVLREDSLLRRWPAAPVAAALFAPVLGVLLVSDTIWWDRHLFWLDIAAGPAVATLLAALTGDRPAWLVRVLDSRPVRSLGSFSYSLYLIHAPIVVAIQAKVAGPVAGTGLAGFAVTLAIAVPVSLGAAWAFAQVFELPFQRYRSWQRLRVAMGLGQASGSAPA